MTLAVVAALPEEIGPLLRRMAGRRRLGGGLVAGRLAGRAVVVGATGDGARRAADGVERVLATGHVEALLGLGLAGGLDPALPRGALVVGQEVCGDGRDQRADAPWAERTAAALGAPRGLLVTAPGLVASSEAKRALRVNHAGSLAVDLETAVWAEAAERAGIPWLVLRAVFDTATQAVPAFLLRAAAPDGRVRRGRLVAGALFRPRRLAALRRMGREARRLAELLADAASPAVLAAPQDDRTTG